MFRRSIWALAALAVLALAPQARSNQARILEATDSEIFIEFATDDFSIEEVVHGGESFSRVTAPDYAWTTEPGLPRLPMDGVLVGVPFGAQVSLDVVSSDADGLGPVRVEPAPFERVTPDREFPVAYQEFIADDAFYAGGGAHPATVAELGFDSRLRHQRVVQILFHPFRFSAGAGELTLYRRIVVRLRISNAYREIMSKPKKGDETQEYILGKLKSARWLIQTIEQRRQTMVKVMRCIVDQQHSFFDRGISHLRPLTLQQVASQIGMHESTVSRVTTNKYVQTPRGVFELKFFFSSGLETASGEDMSAKTARDIIQQLIDGEDKKEPLSDQRIADVLHSRGLHIARRTVAKYREQMGILPARYRKRH